MTMRICVFGSGQYTLLERIKIGYYRYEDYRQNRKRKFYSKQTLIEDKMQKNKYFRAQIKLFHNTYD